MPLPETIPVKYTEEEAAYLSIRPVVRQTFRLDELLDMVLAVTGKEISRIQQVLRSGTVVFNFYRYWWQGFEADLDELSTRLARFPDADPARPFRAEECAAVLLESGGHPPRHSLALSRDAASRRRLFSWRSFWDCLMDLSQPQAPAYQTYSYARRADIFALEISPQQAESLMRAATQAAPRALRAQLVNLLATTRIVFVCPRPG